MKNHVGIMSVVVIFVLVVSMLITSKPMGFHAYLL